jgi:uncharacterized protein YutE (UPF0331/DUF86 family)
VVNQPLLEEKTRLLAEYIADLQEHRHVSLAELKENKLLRRYIERTLHLAVQACLDIGNHLIADLRLREPEDYKDIVAVLTENGILPKEKLEQYQRMAQFRNVIVHDYARVDPEILAGILRQNLEDLVAFAASIKDRFLRP